MNPNGLASFICLVPQITEDICLPGASPPTTSLSPAVTTSRLSAWLAAIQVGPDQFVDHAYRFALGRSPDESGRASVNSALARGESRLKLLVRLCESVEGKSLGTDVPTALATATVTAGLSDLGWRSKIFGDRLQELAWRQAEQGLTQAAQLESTRQALAALGASLATATQQVNQSTTQIQHQLATLRTTELLRARVDNKIAAAGVVLAAEEQVRLASRIDALDARFNHRDTWRKLRDEESLAHFSAAVERLDSVERAAEFGEIKASLASVGESQQTESERLRYVLAALESKITSVKNELAIGLANARHTIDVVQTDHAKQLGRSEAQYDRLTALAATLELAFNKPDSPAVAPVSRPTMEAKFYADLETRFRGSRAAIKDKLRYYVAPIREAGLGTLKSPILDLGCGRGELIELFRDEGWNVRGVDSNPAQLAIARQHLLDVEQGDLIDVLRAVPDASLGVVCAMHVVEHLTMAVLLTMVRECLRVLKPGGMFILETPNPENLLVASLTFHYDPTHHHPLPPDFLQWMVEWSGFSKPTIHRLNPWHGKSLPNLEMPANQELNHLLYGPMDYAIVARREE
jgi:2-polyprenyl-3-methyl-5-hydroxy-6-metoxy-1,4-benzoquinol methylase